MAVELDGRAGVGANGAVLGGFPSRNAGSVAEIPSQSGVRLTERSLAGAGPLDDSGADPLEEPTELDLFDDSEAYDDEDGADDDADDLEEDEGDEDFDDDEEADDDSDDLHHEIPRVTPGQAGVPTARRDPVANSPGSVTLQTSPRAATAPRPTQARQAPTRPTGHQVPVSPVVDANPATLPKPVRELAKLLDDEGYTQVLATLNTVSDKLSVAPCNAFGIEAKSGAAVTRQPVCIARGCILSWVRKLYRSSEPGGAPGFENVSVSLHRAGQNDPYFRAIVPTKPEAVATPDTMLPAMGNPGEAGLLPLMLNFMRQSQSEMRDFMRQQAEDNRKLLETIAHGNGQSDGRAARFMNLADNMVESALQTSIAAIHKVQERVLGGAADELTHAVGGESGGKNRKAQSPNQVLAQAIEDAKERKRLLRDGAKAGVVPAEVVEEDEDEEEEEEDDPWEDELPMAGASPAEEEPEPPEVQMDPLARFANGVKAVAEAVPAVVRGYQQTMSLIRNPGSALNTMAESLEGDAGGGQQ